MEKIIKEKDIYFMDITEDKIIVNDNYEGILVFDTNMNLLKEMQIFDDISIYTSYFLGNDEMILFCPENEKIVYINLMEYTSKVITINENLADIVDIKLFAREEDRCIFITPQKEYIELSWKDRILRRTCENIINKKWNYRTTITEQMKKILLEDDDYINTDVHEQLFVIVYEEKVIFYNGIRIETISPRKNYIFNNAKFVKKENEGLLVILSNNKEDDEISMISMVSIKAHEN